MVSLCVHSTPWWRTSIFQFYANPPTPKDVYFPHKSFMEGKMKYFDFSRFISHDHRNKESNYSHFCSLILKILLVDLKINVKYLPILGQLPFHSSANISWVPIIR